MASPRSHRKSSQRPLPSLLQGADLRGLARLATQAVGGVTDIVEGVHQSVWRTLGAGGEGERTRGLTGLVYRSVRGVTRGVGGGIEALLGAFADEAPDDAASSALRDAWVAALNGVCGDRLARDGNPLATAMTLRHGGVALRDGEPLHANGRILLLVHGLCMNDRQWRDADGHDHGAAIAAALGHTPLYLRYNSGRHVWQNGRALSALLERTLAHWPVPVQSVDVVGHSMGGLVLRSALHAAARDGRHWPAQVRHAVFLGTPHHGAPLERVGNLVDAALAATPFTAPLAWLGQVRSAGITDLRHGHVCADDGRGRDRFEPSPDRRRRVPLPTGIACHTVAATTAASRGRLADHVVGDGLVPLRSALGLHDEATRTLAFAPSSQWIAYRTGHLQLLSRPDVAQRIIEWMR